MLRTLPLALVASLLFAPAAIAAPTCLDRNGDTIRCGTPGAMDVGWTPSPVQLLNRHATRQADTDSGAIEAFAFVFLLLALIALMPDFDGTRPGDWDL